MTGKSHGLLQLILGALQSLNVADMTGYLNFIPPKYSAILILVLTLVQGLVAWYNRYYNPDGTPAAQPFVKEEK